MKRSIGHSIFWVGFCVANACLLVGTSWAEEPADSGPDWAQFRGNVHLTGIAGSDLPVKLEELWSFDTKEPIESSAAIVGDRVFVGTSDGHFYAIDLNTGKVAWKVFTGEYVGVRSSPTVHEGVVYFGDDDGILHAVAAQDGKEVWRFATEGEIVSSAVCWKDRVLFGSYDSYLYCVSLKDGKLLWKALTDGRVHATPGVVEGRCFIAGCDGLLRMIDVQTGQPKSEVSLDAYAGASAAIFGDFVYVGTFGNQVLAIDWRKSELEWVYEHEKKSFPFYASAAVTDKWVIVGGRDKMVHGLNRKDGKAKWTFTTKGRVESSAVIVGDRVYVGSSDGVLYGLGLSSGKEFWRFDTGSSISASPAVGRGRLVFGTEDGVLYCFGAKK